MRTQKLLTLTLLALSAGLIGCGGGGGNGGGGTVIGFEDATFDATVIRPGVGLTTVFARINSSGTAIGSTLIAAGDLRASSWSAAGGFDLLPEPPGFNQSVGTFINDSGTIVGRAITSALDTSPIRISGGLAEALDWSSVGSTGEAQVVNNIGVIGGIVFGVPNSTLVRQNADSTLSSRGPFLNPVCKSINASGTIVGGYETDGSGDGPAFVWSGATFTTFNAPGFNHTIANDVNTAGVIVGRAGRANQVGRAFIRSGGTTTLLANPAGFNNAYATTINDNGVIGGFVADDSGNNPRGCFWVNGTPILINSRVTLSNSGIVTFVNDLNNSGNFLVTVDESGTSFNTLLVPNNLN